MQGAAAAAHVVGARDAVLRVLGALHDLVELLGLGPVALGPALCRVRVGRALRVDKEARLGKDLQVLARVGGKAEDRLGEKVRIGRDLVVVHKDGDVVAKDARDGQAEVLYRAVAAQRYRLAGGPRDNAADGRHNAVALLGADDQGVQVGVGSANAVHARPGRLATGLGRHEQHGHAQDAADPLQRREAGLELGQGLIDGRGVVVDAALAQLAGLVALGPIRRYDDNGVHAAL